MFIQRGRKLKAPVSDEEALPAQARPQRRAQEVVATNHRKYLNVDAHTDHALWIQSINVRLLFPLGLSARASEAQSRGAIPHAHASEMRVVEWLRE